MAELGMTNMDEIKRMTIVEYHWRVEAKRIRDFNKLYDMHQLAYLNEVAGATEKVGKDIVPKYKTLKDFFDVEKKRREILGDTCTKNSTPKLTRHERLMLQANTL